MDTNEIKVEMLKRLENTAELAHRQVSALEALDYQRESSDGDLRDQLTTMWEAVSNLRDVVQRSHRIVPWNQFGGKDPGKGN